MDDSKSQAADQARIGFAPLYRRVRDELVRRIVEREWHPGDVLPNEFELAAGLGVSQGTVRKALDLMASERLVVRQQGRGTFVATHDEQRILFQFFKLAPDGGTGRYPESKVVSVAEAEASAEERAQLELGTSRRVVRLERLRSLGGPPVLFETIVLPSHLFPGIARNALPNNLYGLYSEVYGVTVARASEKLKAIGLSARDAGMLNAREGQPALQIDRIAHSLAGALVEWRVSRVITDSIHYAADLM
jgi:GntR family transcriptional regulator